jgi:putative spermidine/putrescine transport system substrate-binding protein
VADDTTIVPKLISARGRAPYDVISLNDDAAIYLKSLDVLAPDQSARLPNLADTYDSMKPPHTVVYGMTIYEYDLVYRTKIFPIAPTSWQDLWKPGITVGIPYIGQSYGVTFLYLAALLNGGSASNLDPGFAAIKRLENYKIYRNVGHGLTMFQQGEIDAALYYGHRGQQLMDLGFPVGHTRPKEGVFAQRTGTQIPKGTGNMDGAIAWANNCLTAAYQRPFTDEYYSPANRKMDLPPALAVKLIVGDELVASLRDPPWAELLPQRDALLDRWSREISR